MKRSSTGLALLLALGAAGAASAQDMEATIRFTDTAVIVERVGPYTNMMLAISGPNEFYADVSSGSKPPAIDLRKIDKYDDGVYRYRLTGAGDKTVPIRTALDNGRGDIARERRVGVSMQGSFVVKGGVIVKFEDMPENKQETESKQ